MMIGVLFVLLVALLAVWSVRKDTLNRFVLSSIFVVLFLPYEAFSVYGLVEPIRKMSPFALYSILFAALSVLRSDIRNYFTFPKAMLAYQIMFVYIVVLTYLKSGGRGWGTIIDNYLAVFFAMHFMVINRKKLHEVKYEKVAFLISVSALYMVIEFIIKFNPLYYFIFTNAEWVESQWGMGYHRSTGGIGHPLIAATLYIVFIFFLSFYRGKYALQMYGLSFLAIVTTGSRAGFFIAGAYTIYIMYKKNDLRFFSIYIMLAILISSFLLLFGFFDSIIYRTMNADGSTAVRLAVFEILDEVFAVGWFGNGIGTTVDFIERVDFFNAIEITWISFIVEIGFLGLFLFIFSWLFYSYKSRTLKENKMMLFLLLLMVSGYNSLVVHTPIMYVVCLFLFLNSHVIRETHNKVAG